MVATTKSLALQQYDEHRVRKTKSVCENVIESKHNRCGKMDWEANAEYERCFVMKSCRLTLVSVLGGAIFKCSFWAQSICKRLIPVNEKLFHCLTNQRNIRKHLLLKKSTLMANLEYFLLIERVRKCRRELRNNSELVKIA